MKQNADIQAGALPQRAGDKPRTTDTNPHTQLDQIAPVKFQEKLAAYMFNRECVEQRPSIISVPGARGMWISDACAVNPNREAFLLEREHAHIHPEYDGSLHMALPLALVDEAIEKGWAESHPLIKRGLVPKTDVMVYGPRDEDELAVIKYLVDASFRFAHAETDTPAN